MEPSMRYALALARPGLSCRWRVSGRARNRADRRQARIRRSQARLKEPITTRSMWSRSLSNAAPSAIQRNGKEGKLDIGSYENADEGGQERRAVKPGKSQDSPLYHARCSARRSRSCRRAATSRARRRKPPSLSCGSTRAPRPRRACAHRPETFVLPPPPAFTPSAPSPSAPTKP